MHHSLLHQYSHLGNRKVWAVEASVCFARPNLQGLSDARSDQLQRYHLCMEKERAYQNFCTLLVAEEQAWAAAAAAKADADGAVEVAHWAVTQADAWACVAERRRWNLSSSSEAEATAEEADDEYDDQAMVPPPWSDEEAARAKEAAVQAVARAWHFVGVWRQKEEERAAAAAAQTAAREHAFSFSAFGGQM